MGVAVCGPFHGGTVSFPRWGQLSYLMRSNQSTSSASRVPGGATWRGPFHGGTIVLSTVVPPSNYVHWLRALGVCRCARVCVCLSIGCTPCLSAWISGSVGNWLIGAWAGLRNGACHERLIGALRACDCRVREQIAAWDPIAPERFRHTPGTCHAPTTQALAITSSRHTT